MGFWVGWGLKLLMRDTRMHICSDIDCVFHERGSGGVDCGVQHNSSELQHILLPKSAGGQLAVS